jgi:hypothetical protein
MKELADGKQVTSRGFYFLLDWNDRDDKKIMYGLYGVMRLAELELHQYAYLMEKAMADELTMLKNG